MLLLCNSWCHSIKYTTNVDAQACQCKIYKTTKPNFLQVWFGPDGKIANDPCFDHLAVQPTASQPREHPWQPHYREAFDLLVCDLSWPCLGLSPGNSGPQYKMFWELRKVSQGVWRIQLQLSVCLRTRLCLRCVCLVCHFPLGVTLCGMVCCLSQAPFTNPDTIHEMMRLCQPFTPNQIGFCFTVDLLA